MPFAELNPLYVQKAERKGRTRAEVDQILCWLTGHDGASLQRAIDTGVDLEMNEAPCYHPHAERITGTVCGVRVEVIEDPTMRKVRRMDKLIDELAKGKAMAKILRA